MARNLGVAAISALIIGAGFMVMTPRVPAQTAPAKLLTVERIFGGPSLSGTILRGTQWSPDGKWLAYLGNDDQAGGQALCAIDASDGQRHVLVDAGTLRSILLPPESRGQSTGLGRFAVPRFLWAPNSQAILFISADELFWYDLNSKTSKELLGASKNSTPGSSGTATAIDDAKISPDARWVSFVRDHDVWAVNVASGSLRQVTRGGTDDIRNGELDWVYPEELRLGTAYWWAPDSSRIAYLQLDERGVSQYPLVDFLSPKADVIWERYPIAGSANPIARVGVALIASGKTEWLDTGGDTSALLARVDWLPDSRGVAIRHMNREQNRLDLLVADVKTGKSRTVLTEQDPYWVNLNGGPYFLAEGRRFLWLSERSGFRHVYIYDLDGKQQAQLTRGDWEVEYVDYVDEANGEVYFTATAKSPIERQLYRVPLAGVPPGGTATPEPLTTEPGTHGIAMAPDGRHFLDTFSTAMRPPRQTLYRNDGSVVATIAENKDEELAEYRLSPVEFVRVPGADGTLLDGEIIKPANFNATKRYPVLVSVYGGPSVQTVLNAWEGPTFLWNEMMAQKGFIILALDNRGGTGHGHKFETAIFHHLGEVELADQVAAVKWLEKQPYVDAGRVGIWGWSYGGTMVCLALLRAGDVFKAGFAGAPVTDWRQYDTIYTERYMGTPQENPEGYRDASPVTYAGALKGKLLIAQATGDDNVHFANTVELQEKFVEAQKYAEIQIYAGRGHGISDEAAQLHVFNRVTQFLSENLDAK